MAQQVITSAGLIRGSTAIAQLYDNTATGNITEWDITSIAQTYNHLRLIIMARGDTTAVSVGARVQFNGDTAANYGVEGLNATNVTASAGVEAVVSSMQGGDFAAASASASNPGFSELMIPHYTGTTFFKGLAGYGGHSQSTAASGQNYKGLMGTWRSTSAVNRIRVFASAGNFIAGSRITLYGMV